ncbi:MAG: protein-disulfide reductase DsbD [Fluviicoccus sp.]|uniref:protein-disulfide reductase DsbD n=1 Tax=Fluviicoccus sp. TaxID=2003552 RepID=UPI002722C3E2|nr:protein-disulfide reductase DsbD [Fluviicoccus sp.]MDO8330793.1 protein-disulfide reductase DsbD [Fluviicoccus sp.]
MRQHVLQLIILVLSWLVLYPVAGAAELKRFDGGALPSFTGIKSNERDFLPAEQAFRLLAEPQGDALSLQFVVAPGYYLYKDRFRFQVKSGNVIVGEAGFNHPPEWKDDAEFGRVQVYHSDVLVNLHLNGQGEVQVGWQGCAEAGLCYPPQSQVISVSASARTPDIRITPKDVSIPIPTIVPTITYDVEEDTGISQTDAAPAENQDPGIIPTPAPAVPDQFNLADRPLLALLTLWVLGLGLAFTPCVLPMLPIVAGLVARQHAGNARQGFLLALAYGIGVACSYGTLGALISLFGGQANLALWLQHPAVLVVFSLLFAVLALASFDVFHLQLPSAAQHHLDALSRKGKAGSYAGTMVIGFFSALVVSPCVSAPLAGVLLTVSAQGNVVMGFSALFALGLGLSTPLMILGASEGRFMPKSGLWMNRVKQAFGVMLLGVSISLLNRMLPGPASLFLWAVLCAGTAFWLNLWGGKWRVVWRTLSYTGLIWAAALLAGAASGGSNPLQPLQHLGQGAATPSSATAFRTIRNSMELDALLETSRSARQPLLLDFYADWCVSCKVMDREIFSRPETLARLQNWQLVRADITDNTPASRDLLKRFQLFGPPAVLFFQDGQERTEARVVGEMTLEGFEQHLQQYPMETPAQ